MWLRNLGMSCLLAAFAQGLYDTEVKLTGASAGVGQQGNRAESHYQAGTHG